MLIKSILQKNVDRLRLAKLRKGNQFELCIPSRISLRKISFSGRNFLRVGKHTIIHGGISCQKEGASVEIGERVFIGADTKIVATSSVQIGNDVLIAHSCYITDTDGHSIDYKKRASDVLNRWRGLKDWSDVKSLPVTIGRHCWIGPNSIVLKGVSIGEGAVVCAGSVVTKDVPAMTMVGGVPAGEIKKLG